MNEALKTNRKRTETRRLEWSALFAVAFLLVALAPQMGAQTLSAQALGSSLAFSSHAPQFALAQLSAQTLAVQSAASSFLASRNASRLSFSASTNFHLDKQHGISTPQFGRTFSQSAIALPTFSLFRTHARHRFAASLPAHIAAFLSGTRTNHFDE